MEGDDTLPKANQGASKFEVMVRDSVDDEAEAEAKSDGEEIVHYEIYAGISTRGRPR
jgi:hypothetical protein